ncbi:hypothetical protein LXD69_10270 [Flavobacterium sediminilitoris]|uniref:Uncharacterized protein n=1 Tax=Flavobacterium sediminilitoris TaxID=2024526 RepID=A0ABY4HJL6_9FLAO|nr:MULTISPECIES: hypothetical protein [Flavobacterium]UOX32437.1 hypothetical protein LXD69_10270 [Flavobacterium sediminilitoris]
MSIIKIFANNIELNFQKDTLRLKKENNSLSSEFKVTHSTAPFLIIENENTKKALGSSDITSINKKKIIPVTVLELGVKYYGELQQLSVLNGFRKCNLKYNSELLTVINKKISEFMPIVSVIPDETDPEPFSEISDSVLTGVSYWETYPLPFLDKSFPEIRWQFPSMYWKNKFGTDLELDDPWYLFQNYINLFDIDETLSGVFVENTYDVDIVNSIISVEQKNVAAPQVYLLSPLFYIFESINWKIKGDFVNHELVKKILFFSKNNNMCKTNLYLPTTDVIFDQPTWFEFSSGPYLNYRKNENFTGLAPGNYIVFYYFELQQDLSVSDASKKIKLQIFGDITITAVDVWKRSFDDVNGGDNIVQGTFEVAVTGDLKFHYFNPQQQMPVDYYIRFTPDISKEYTFMHPTLNLGRFLPEWSVGSYINNLKNLFNLDVDIDDFKKTITLNFNENIDINEKPVIIEKSMVRSSYDLAANSSFVLKYANNEDASLFISINDIAVSSFTKELHNGFKLVPNNEVTANLSEDLENKEGTGLMIYAPINAPYISNTTEEGYSLEMEGNKGIHDSFWKKWLKFRLSASSCEIVGAFTEPEIARIYKAKAIYLDNQRYRLVSIEFTETSNKINELKMILESINI